MTQASYSMFALETTLVWGRKGFRVSIDRILFDGVLYSRFAAAIVCTANNYKNYCDNYR